MAFPVPTILMITILLLLRPLPLRFLLPTTFYRQPSSFLPPRRLSTSELSNFRRPLPHPLRCTRLPLTDFPSRTPVFD